METRSGRAPGEGRVSKSAKIMAVVGVLLLAVAFYALRAGNVNDVTDRTDYKAKLKCRACDHEFTAELQTAARAPFKCANCGKMTAWQLWQCNQCGTTFVPDPVGDPPHPPIMAGCPKCSSSLTGMVPVK